MTASRCRAVTAQQVRQALVRRPVRLGPATLLWHPRTLAVCILAAALLTALLLVELAQGSSDLGTARIAAALIDGPASAGRDGRIVWGIRLPRAVTAVLVGACLGASGAVFQSASRNALGSPDIIGFLSGASCGAVAAIVLAGAGPGAVALASLGGGLATTAAVLALAGGRGSASERIVLVGIGVGALLSALTTILLTRADPDVAIGGRIWLTGTLNARTWSHAGIAVVAVVTCLPLTMLASRALETLELGDDVAQGAGVPIRRVRTLAGLAGTGLAAAATAAAGPISFVALAAPHISRAVARSGSVPLVVSSLIGALLLLAADVLTQSLPLPGRVPVALTTGVLGGVYLIRLLGRLR